MNNKEKLFFQGKSEASTEKNFKKDLLEFLKTKFSKDDILSYYEEQKEKEKTKKLDSLINEQDVFTILEKYGIDSKLVQQRDKNSFKIDVLVNYEGKKLPDGYAYKGGAARSLLLRSLGINKNSQPRDFDLLRYTKKEAYKGADDKLAAEFMPLDFSYGDGVEIISSINNYFSNRDFTINELLATNTTIIASKACLLDTVRHIIRLSDFEKQKEIKYDKLAEKLFVKALRLYSLEILDYEASIHGIENYRIDSRSVGPFFIALNLDRAMGMGETVAARYVQELVNKKLVPGDITTIKKMIKYLDERLYDFYFRFLDKDSDEIESQLLEDDLKYLNKAKYQSTKKFK